MIISIINYLLIILFFGAGLVSWYRSIFKNKDYPKGFVYFTLAILVISPPVFILQNSIKFTLTYMAIGVLAYVINLVVIGLKKNK